MQIFHLFVYGFKQSLGENDWKNRQYNARLRPLKGYIQIQWNLVINKEVGYNKTLL